VSDRQLIASLNPGGALRSDRVYLLRAPGVNPARHHRLRRAGLPHQKHFLDETGKLAHYATPPISPTAHRSSFFDTSLGGSKYDRPRVMEGDEQQRRQHDQSSYAARGFGQNPAQQQSGVGASERYRQPLALGPRDPTASGSGGRSGIVPGYGNYGYAEQPQYGAPSLATSSMQYSSDYAPNTQRQTQQQFPQYAPSMMYNVPQQPPPQSPYESVPQYQPRQSAAIEVLSTQFGVPPYYASNEPTSVPGPAVPQSYAPTQFVTYPHQPSVGRPSLGQSYPTAMAEFAQQGAPEVLEQQELAQEPSSFDDAYHQYQNALRQTFENTRGGRLVEAGQSLLEISGWLLGHAEELGEISSPHLPTRVSFELMRPIQVWYETSRNCTVTGSSCGTNSTLAGLRSYRNKRT